MDPTEVEKQKRNFDTKQKLFKAVIGIKREQEDEDIPDKLPSPILNTKGGEGGGGDRGGKKLSLQMTNSSGSMSAVSHNHMSFDVDYLFVLSFAYIYRFGFLFLFFSCFLCFLIFLFPSFAVQNRFMEPNCVSSFSSLLGLVPAACRDSLKVFFFFFFFFFFSLPLFSPKINNKITLPGRNRQCTQHCRICLLLSSPSWSSPYNV